MSGDDRSGGDDPYAGRVQQAGAVRGEAVSQAEIDEVLNDARLSAGEREARLKNLRQRVLDDVHADNEDEYAPLQSRLMDALSMLAEEGHDYAGSSRVEAESSEPLPEDERSLRDR